MIARGDKRVTPYYEGGKPLEVRLGDVRIAGWKWGEQTGPDMPFEETYEDRVDVVALGRSKQEVTVQGKNLLDVAGGSFSGQTTLIIMPVTPGVTYSLSANIDNTDKAAAQSRVSILQYNGSTFLQVSHRGNLINTGATGVSKVENVVALANATSFSIIYSQSIVDASLSRVSQVQLELGPVVTAYEPFTPGTPSPGTPSPIISAAGELRVEGRNLINIPDQIITKTSEGYYIIQTYPNPPFMLEPNQVYTLAFDYNFLTDVRTALFGIGYGANPGKYQYDIIAAKTSGLPRVGTYVVSFSRATYNVATPFVGFRFVWMPIASTDVVSTKISNVRFVRGSYIVATTPPYTPYRPIITLALPELRAIPDGAGGWLARDELYVERVGGELHLMRRQRVGREIYTGGETQIWSKNVDSADGNYISFFRHKLVNGALQSSSARHICNRAPFAQWMPPTGNYWWNADVSMGMRIHKSYLEPYGYAPALANAEKIVCFRALLAAWYAAGDPMIVDYVLTTPIITDLGPIDLPSYYPYTRVLVEGDYPPDVTARCRVVDHDI